MKRLTEEAPFKLDTFNRCQLCGHASDDICEFRMWQECDDQDQPEPYNMLVLCRSKKCRTMLNQHERLYREMPWGRGQPGHLMLLCGGCGFRNGTRCTHPDLKINGGEGLTLYKDGLPGTIVCYHDDTKPDGGLRCDFEGFPSPFSKCDGFKERSKEP